jgi:hypothetical protein
VCCACRQAGTALTRLTALDVSHCIGLTLNSVRGFDALRRLDARCCDSLAASAAAPALESFGVLEELLLDGCGLLSQLTLRLPRLATVSLLDCRALVSVRPRPRPRPPSRLRGAAASTGLG